MAIGNHCFRNSTILDECFASFSALSSRRTAKATCIREVIGSNKNHCSNNSTITSNLHVQMVSIYFCSGSSQCNLLMT